MSARPAAASTPSRPVSRHAPGLEAAKAVATAAALAESVADDAARVDVAGMFPERAFEMLRDRGLLAAPVPEAFGGASLSEPRFRLQLLQVLAHLGRGSLPVGRLYEGHVNALALVEAFGDAAQRARWHAQASQGRLFGVWNTEAAGGVLLREGEGGGIRLEGSKTFASGAGHVGLAVVTGRDPGGRWQMAVLDLDLDPPSIDRSFWQPLGMRASASYKVDLSGILVDRDALLGAPDDYYREPEFGTGAIRFAAVQQGGVEAVFDATRAFLRRHGRIDDPYQRARAGEMAMLVASGRQWLHGAATKAVAQAAIDGGGIDAAGAVAYADLMRSAIEANALRVLQLAERSVGARGLMQGEPFERLHRDLTHYLRQAGPDAAIAGAGRHVLERAEPAYALWRD